MTEATVTNPQCAGQFESQPVNRLGTPFGPIPWLSGCIALLLALISAQPVQAEQIGGFVVPGSRAATLDTCVEPTRAMRRYHMEYIRHQRDTTVYDGIRHTKYSLSGCVDCHAAHDAKGIPVPVSNKGQFCNACHETAAVTLNCFDCHATVPDGESWNRVTQESHPEGHQERHPGDPHAPGSGIAPVRQGAALAQVPRAARQKESLQQ
jgi:predicted CXXCH cytochrome family protein